jgi:hypothetical protein
MIQTASALSIRLGTAALDQSLPLTISLAAAGEPASVHSIAASSKSRATRKRSTDANRFGAPQPTSRHEPWGIVVDRGQTAEGGFNSFNRGEEEATMKTVR